MKIQNKSVTASTYSGNVYRDVQSLFDDFVDTDIMNLATSPDQYNELAEAADRLLLAVCDYFDVEVLD